MPSLFVTQHPTDFTLRLTVAGLRSAEDVSLDLDVILVLRIVDPDLFDTQFGPASNALTEQRLAELLAETARSELAPLFRRLSLEELDSNRELRGWLSSAIQRALRDEADLAGRSGLMVRGVDAYDLRCYVWDEVRRAKEAAYLRYSIATAEARQRRLLDQALLEELTQHLETKKAVLQRKEELTRLEEQERARNAQPRWQREADQRRREERLALLRRSPSTLRPEIWRYDLRAQVDTAPLFYANRVYIATRSGLIYAFRADDGEPVWPNPVELGVQPGDGLALLEGILCIPAYNGRLYRLKADTGERLPTVEVGGALSSAPAVDGRYLYLSTDVHGLNLQPGFGRVVVVDPCAGTVHRAWQVASNAGLRAMPTLYGDRIYVADRRGSVYAVDRRSSRVRCLTSLSSPVVGAVCIDPQRRQLVAGQVGHPFVTALDLSGQVSWQQQLDGVVVGRPLLTEHGLFVGTSGGSLYRLDAATGRLRGDPFRTGGPIATSALVYYGLVIFGSADGYLYAVDVASGELFWKYFSGSPILLAPALTSDGRLVVVDREGRLSALRWCLSRYAEGARHLERVQPPLWREAAELWALAGEVEEAIRAAQQGGHLDFAAELAFDLGWYERAGELFEQLARRFRQAEQRAERWWEKAALSWRLAGNADRAQRCLVADAQDRRAPLLSLRPANAPPLSEGQSGELQVEVRNEGPALACKVVLAYQGHVPRAGQMELGAIGPGGSRLVTLAVVGARTGAAVVKVTTTYTDSLGKDQQPVTEEISFWVNRPPEVHHHYYGPHIDGDGVIIVRGGVGGSRQITVRSNDDTIKLA